MHEGSGGAVNGVAGGGCGDGGSSGRSVSAQRRAVHGGSLAAADARVACGGSGGGGSSDPERRRAMHGGLTGTDGKSGGSTGQYEGSGVGLPRHGAKRTASAPRERPHGRVTKPQCAPSRLTATQSLSQG